MQGKNPAYNPGYPAPAGFVISSNGPAPAPPPSYMAAVGGQPQPEHFPTNRQIDGGVPIITNVVPVGPAPTRMTCPSCAHEVNTVTKTQPGIIAYISGVVIALLGGWCGCCLIPCCIDECMDIHHNCPNCGAYLGRFRR